MDTLLDLRRNHQWFLKPHGLRRGGAREEMVRSGLLSSLLRLNLRLSFSSWLNIVRWICVLFILSPIVLSWCRASQSIVSMKRGVLICCVLLFIHNASQQLWLPGRNRKGIPEIIPTYWFLTRRVQFLVLSAVAISNQCSLRFLLRFLCLSFSEAGHTYGIYAYVCIYHTGTSPPQCRGCTSTLYVCHTSSLRPEISVTFVTLLRKNLALYRNVM